jgi:hypothetical protein
MVRCRSSTELIPDLVWLDPGMARIDGRGCEEPIVPSCGQPITGHSGLAYLGR